MKRKQLPNGRGSILHRVRIAQTKSAAAETKGGQRGQPRQRKPSMPAMPWEQKPRS